MAIRTYPGVEQGMVGASISLDRSTMASIVTRLEERGLISRIRLPTTGASGSCTSPTRARRP